MKTRIFTSCCLLLLAVPAWGQSPPLPAGGAAQRPLNLSLPRDVLTNSTAVIRTESEDTATRNLRQEKEENGKRAERQPYGTGYEARQRGMASGSNSGFGGGDTVTGSGSGAGGGGRGGMGRGR